MQNLNQTVETPQRVLAILGSTGSIGVQALEVVDQCPQKFRPFLLSARQNFKLLAEQAHKYRPKYVVIDDESLFSSLKSALEGTGVQVLAGKKALCEAVQDAEIDVVLTAMVGFAGLAPTLAAIESGKTIALANKETMVVAGKIISQKAKEKGVSIIPVDSEHSAIFQCLVGEPEGSLAKIILTASGGPFRGYSAEKLQKVTLQQALKHPNWSMGAKITIDSASMMNKGLEVIQAKWLFDLTNDQIEIVVHPQSIIHSLVEFCDGSLKAQLGMPDMRLPIQYALGYPKRLCNDFPRFKLSNYAQFTFEEVDRTVFRSLNLAAQALEKCGNLPCILNAANEIAVDAFLKEKITFTQIYDAVETALDQLVFLSQPDLEALFETDKQTRIFVKDLLKISA